MTAKTIEWRTELRLPGGPLECTVRRSPRARRLRLTVDPRVATIVTIPTRAARSRVDAERLALGFAAEREPWLRRHLERRAAARALLAAGPFGDAAIVRYRGEPHLIRVVAAPAHLRRSRVIRCGVESGDELVVEIAAGERRSPAVLLETWLRARAREAIEREVARHGPPLGVAARLVTIRDQRTRWGSCSRLASLSFSWRLVLAPPEALETVVVHELGHLRVFGHGPAFWALVAAEIPDHRRWRRWLREHAAELHAALDTDASPGLTGRP